MPDKTRKSPSETREIIVVSSIFNERIRLSQGLFIPLLSYQHTRVYLQKAAANNLAGVQDTAVKYFFTTQCLMCLRVKSARRVSIACRRSLERRKKRGNETV